MQPTINAKRSKQSQNPEDFSNDQKVELIKLVLSWRRRISLKTRLKVAWSILK